jgi:hypothetical protein
MRIALCALLAAFACMAQADRPGCGDRPVLTSIKDDGTAIGIVISDEQRSKMPRWSIDSGDPPLALSKAIAAAKAWAKKAYTRYDDVRVDSISLSSFGCATARDQWYYLVNFSPIIDGNVLFGGTYFAAVLMDGSVVAPVPVKRDF